MGEQRSTFACGLTRPPHDRTAWYRRDWCPASESSSAGGGSSRLLKVDSMADNVDTKNLYLRRWGAGSAGGGGGVSTAHSPNGVTGRSGRESACHGFGYGEGKTLKPFEGPLLLPPDHLHPVGSR
jgi:hypothetical protein